MISLRPFTWDILDRFRYVPHRRAIAQAGGADAFTTRLRALCEASETTYGLLDEKILFIAGLRPSGIHLGKPFAAEIWAAPCASVHRHAKEVWRGALMLHGHNALLTIPRVWASVVHDDWHNLNAGFLERLGYEREGTMRHWDAEGRTYSMYARIHAPTLGDRAS